MTKEKVQYYKVNSVNPTIILNNSGRPQKGFTVSITLLPFNEERIFDVLEKDTKTIDSLAMDEWQNRFDLDQLGSEELDA